MDLTPKTWLSILASAYTLFDDAEARGFGTPPFSLGGGTVLMLSFQHRLSKDIGLFGYDAQWLSVLSPRLNAAAGRLARDYVEQSNSVKIIMPEGDIDFIVAADATSPVDRQERMLAGRRMPIEPITEILGKKLLYRAAGLAARDIYDLSAAIDLAPRATTLAARAAKSRREVLARRFRELSAMDRSALRAGIVPYEGRLRHADAMVAKVEAFVLGEIDRGGRVMNRDVMMTARNAVENSSRVPVPDADILAMLATGDGPGHLVRALFGDCAFETLDRLGAAHDVSRATIRAAYAVARQRHAAYNAGLEPEGA